MSVKILISAALSMLAFSDAIAAVPFKKNSNGDLTIKVSRITKRHIGELGRDIPGNQGKCVRFQILDFQDYEMNDAIMRLPAERQGIEFESLGDGHITVICARFSEDHYDSSGDLERSTGYEEIEGYER